MTGETAQIRGFASCSLAHSEKQKDFAFLSFAARIKKPTRIVLANERKSGLEWVQPRCIHRIRSCWWICNSYPFCKVRIVGSRHRKWWRTLHNYCESTCPPSGRPGNADTQRENGQRNGVPWQSSGIAPHTCRFLLVGSGHPTWGHSVLFRRHIHRLFDSLAWRHGRRGLSASTYRSRPRSAVFSGRLESRCSPCLSRPGTLWPAGCRILLIYTPLSTCSRRWRSRSSCRVWRCTCRFPDSWSTAGIRCRTWRCSGGRCRPPSIVLPAGRWKMPCRSCRWGRRTCRLEPGSAFLPDRPRNSSSPRWRRQHICRFGAGTALLAGRAWTPGSVDRVWVSSRRTWSHSRLFLGRPVTRCIPQPTWPHRHRIGQCTCPLLDTAMIFCSRRLSSRHTPCPPKSIARSACRVGTARSPDGWRGCTHRSCRCSAPYSCTTVIDGTPVLFADTDRLSQWVLWRHSQPATVQLRSSIRTSWFSSSSLFQFSYLSGTVPVVLCRVSERRLFTYHLPHREKF